jgi:SAM-dependent methyltransferase
MHTSRDEIMRLEDLLRKYEDSLNDAGVVGSSYTLSAINLLRPALEHLRDQRVKTMLDLGCGYGVLTLIVAEAIGVKRCYAIDVDENRLDYMKRLSRKACVDIITLRQDFSKPISLPEEVHLVTVFGSLEHNVDWDETLENIRSNLVKGGFVLISMPNLGSWVNRVALLLGYQPRDLEISRKKAFGVAPFFSKNAIGHIKVATFGAFKEFLKDNGFDIIVARPLYSKEGLLINLVDKILFTPRFSRRFYVLAKLRNK